jgi:hypothetical protein
VSLIKCHIQLVYLIRVITILRVYFTHCHSLANNFSHCQKHIQVCVTNAGSTYNIHLNSLQYLHSVHPVVYYNMYKMIKLTVVATKCIFISLHILVT